MLAGIPVLSQIVITCTCDPPVCRSFCSTHGHIYDYLDKDMTFKLHDCLFSTAYVILPRLCIDSVIKHLGFTLHCCLLPLLAQEAYTSHRNSRFRPSFIWIDRTSNRQEELLFIAVIASLLALWCNNAAPPNDTVYHARGQPKERKGNGTAHNGISGRAK